MLGVVVFAQDTIPGKNNLANSRRATVSVNSSFNKKDSSVSAGKNQWPNDSTNKKGWPNNDNTLHQSNATKGDSSMNSNAQSSNRDSSTATYKKQEKKQDTSATSSSNMSADKKANGSDASTSSKETLTDRVMMKDDKMYIVKNNESAILDKNYKLPNGVFVTADGSVNYPGGKTVKLKNGQFIELTPATSSSTSATKTTSKPAAKKTPGTTKKKPGNP